MPRYPRSLRSQHRAEIPRIACFNRAKTPFGVDCRRLIAALQVYVDEHVVPVWGTPAKLVLSKGFVEAHWALIFLDDSNQQNDLAYHEVTPEGDPQSKVFVKSTLADGSSISASASHELVEMLVDPALNLMTTGPNPSWMYAYESADPVEEESFHVRGFEMSDFVYPAYFEDFHARDSVHFDHLRKVRKPFQILAGGYQTVFKNGKWTDVSGSPSKRARLAAEDRRGHRSEQRKAAGWRRSRAD